MRLAESRALGHVLSRPGNPASGGTFKTRPPTSAFLLPPRSRPCLLLWQLLLNRPLIIPVYLDTDLTIRSSHLDHPPHPSPPRTLHQQRILSIRSFSPLPISRSPEHHKRMQRTFPTVSRASSSSLAQECFNAPRTHLHHRSRRQCFPRASQHGLIQKNAGKSVPRWCCEFLKQIRKG